MNKFSNAIVSKANDGNGWWLWGYRRGRVELLSKHDTRDEAIDAGFLVPRTKARRDHPVAVRNVSFKESLTGFLEDARARLEGKKR
ncbi:MAG: hypothetical protein ACU0BF_05345 [Paracoccaceae bacterium]